MVNRAEENVATDSSEDENCSSKVGQHDGGFGEVLCLKSVHPRKPDKRSPCEVEPKVVMADVNSAQIPILVDEEIHNVNGVKEGCYQNGVCDIAMNLILVCNEGEVTREY